MLHTSVPPAPGRLNEERVDAHARTVQGLTIAAAPASLTTALRHLDRHRFGPSGAMAPRTVRPSGTVVPDRPLDALFFGHGDTAWLVVADDADGVRRVRLAASNS